MAGFKSGFKIDLPNPAPGGEQPDLDKIRGLEPKSDLAQMLTKAAEFVNRLTGEDKKMRAEHIQNSLQADKERIDTKIENSKTVLAECAQLVDSSILNLEELEKEDQGWLAEQNLGLTEELQELPPELGREVEQGIRQILTVLLALYHRAAVIERIKDNLSQKAKQVAEKENISPTDRAELLAGLKTFQNLTNLSLKIYQLTAMLTVDLASIYIGVSSSHPFTSSQQNLDFSEKANFLQAAVYRRALDTTEVNLETI